MAKHEPKVYEGEIKSEAKEFYQILCWINFDPHFLFVKTSTR